MRNGFLSPGRGEGKSMKLYGKCRFSGYHFPKFLQEPGIKIDRQKSLNGL